MRKKFSAIQGSFSLCYRFKIATVFFKKMQSGVMDEDFRTGTVVGGDLGQLRFLLGRKVNFHRRQVREDLFR